MNKKCQCLLRVVFHQTAEFWGSYRNVFVFVLYKPLKHAEGVEREERVFFFFTVLKYFNEDFYSISKIVICKFESKTRCQERINIS